MRTAKKAVMPIVKNNFLLSIFLCRSITQRRDINGTNKVALTNKTPIEVTKHNIPIKIKEVFIFKDKELEQKAPIIVSPPIIATHLP